MYITDDYEDYLFNQSDSDYDDMRAMELSKMRKRIHKNQDELVEEENERINSISGTEWRDQV